MANENDLDLDETGEQTPPRPRTSGLTVILCVLNVLAAAGFAYLLVLDYTRRQAWSHSVFMHDLRIVGLPLKDELAEGTSVSRLILPKQNLDNAVLKAVYTRRGGKSVSEPFENVQEAFQYRILPEHLTPAVLNEHFGAGPKVSTLEEEMTRVKGAVLEDIEKAAEGIAAAYKGEPQKRVLLARLLMDLARTPQLVDRLKQQVDTAKPANLDKMIIDAAQRRMLVDILTPLEIYRGAPINPLGKFDEKKPVVLKPGDLDNVQRLNSAGDVELVSLKSLQEMLTRRLDAAVAEKFDPGVHFGNEWRDQPQSTVDRRKAIANILTAIANVRKPGVQVDPKDPTKDLLYPEGPDRAMAVVGVYEYTLAYQNLTRAFLILQPLIVEIIDADREGIVHQGDTEKRRIGGFVQAYTLELDEMRNLIKKISEESKLLSDKYAEAKGHQGLVADRTNQVAEQAKLLIKARGETAKAQAELEDIQRKLFDAQLALVNAVRINEHLNELIREAQGLKKRK